MKKFLIDYMRYRKKPFGAIALIDILRSKQLLYIFLGRLSAESSNKVLKKLGGECSTNRT